MSTSCMHAYPHLLLSLLLLLLLLLVQLGAAECYLVPMEVLTRTLARYVSSILSGYLPAAEVPIRAAHAVVRYLPRQFKVDTYF